MDKAIAFTHAHPKEKATTAARITTLTIAQFGRTFEGHMNVEV